MRWQHADMHQAIFRCSSMVDGTKFNLALHASFACAQHVVCRKKKNQSIFNAVTDKRHATAIEGSGLCVLCAYGMEETPVFNGYLFFRYSLLNMSKAIISRLHHKHTHTPDTILLPWFNWIKIPNRIEWSCASGANVNSKKRTPQNWLSSIHAVRNVLEIVKLTLIFGLFLIWFD